MHGDASSQSQPMAEEQQRTAAEQRQPEPEPDTNAAAAVPDYLASPNAVFNDEGVEWRYGSPPDYSKTRKVWEETKHMKHAAGSLPQLVENLVKNWEVEASFKPRLSDWRTIDHANYTFAINGGPPQSAEYMLKHGTYNAIITPNQYYDPSHSDFASSHKTFKRMMPTFAWEVIEVYSGPPKVSFKWRHWGVMKNDYVGFNDKGQKVTAKAHGGPIEIYGVTVAQVDDKVRLQSVDTWFDPLEMFRQIAPGGIVNTEPMNKKFDPSEALDMQPEQDGIKIARQHQPGGAHAHEPAPQDVIPPHISSSTGKPADAFVPHQGADSTKAVVDRDNATVGGGNQIVDTAARHGAEMPIDHPVPTMNGGGACPFLSGQATTTTSNAEPSRPEVPEQTPGSTEPVAVDAVDEYLDKPAEQVHPHPKTVERAVQPGPGEAVVAPATSEETRETKREMSGLDDQECPVLLNRE